VTGSVVDLAANEDRPPPHLEPRRSVRADLREIGAEVIRYREVLTELTRRDLRIRYKQAIMGIVWAVLTPLVVALSGWILRLAFGSISGAPASSAELAGIAVKAIGWSFFVGALGFGTASITANLPLVTKVYFPRALLPLSAVATQVVDTAVGVAALIVVLPFFDVHLSRQLLWVPVLAALLVALTTGITLLASCANVFFRDAKHLVQLVMSFGIFFTPVFFNAEAFGVWGRTILMANPLGPVLEGLRLAIVQGHDLLSPLAGAAGGLAWSPWYLAWSAVWAIGAALGGALIFHRAEFAFAEYV
jgi:ABC-type polysaccharide/polyol phosphate export permease